MAVQAEGSIDIQPYVTDFPCEKKADVKHITSPDPPLKSRRTSVVLDAVGIMKERVGDDVPVIAGVVDPAGLAPHTPLENIKALLKARDIYFSK